MHHPFVLPPAWYPLVAPLPIPLAQHVYQYWQGKAASSFEQEQPFSLQELAEKRRSVYVYMDSFVRNRHEAGPHHVKLSTQWVRQAMGMYTPEKQEIPPKTFNHWLSHGFLRMERKGQPTPDSAAALLLLRMLLPGKRLLPHAMPKEEPPWWCFMQPAPDAPIQSIPITSISDLASATLLWTPWAGAAWDKAWVSLGVYGAIRFAGVQVVDGHIAYTITAPDLKRWTPHLSACLLAGPFEVIAFQALVRLALVHLSPRRMGEQKEEKTDD